MRARAAGHDDAHGGARKGDGNSGHYLFVFSRGPFSLISVLLPNTHWTPLRAHWRIRGRLREKLIPADDVAIVLKRLHYSTISY